MNDFLKPYPLIWSQSLTLTQFLNEAYAKTLIDDVNSSQLGEAEAQ